MEQNLGSALCKYKLGNPPNTHSSLWNNEVVTKWIRVMSVGFETSLSHSHPSERTTDSISVLKQTQLRPREAEQHTSLSQQMAWDPPASDIYVFSALMPAHFRMAQGRNEIMNSKVFYRNANHGVNKKNCYPILEPITFHTSELNSLPQYISC